MEIAEEGAGLLLGTAADKLTEAEKLLRQFISSSPNRSVARDARLCRRTISRLRDDVMMLHLRYDCDWLPPAAEDGYTCARCRTVVPVGQRCRCGELHPAAGLARYEPDALPPSPVERAECRSALVGIWLVLAFLIVVWGIAFFAWDSGWLRLPRIPL